MGKAQYTEQELIRGCRKGKRRYQELLYSHFYGFGMSVCLRYTYSRNDALEVLNDSFMKVFEHIQTFDETRPFKSWFRRILVNTALDHYRSNRNYRLYLSFDEDQMELAGKSDTGNPEGYDLNISSDLILGLFNQMPQQYRLTFNLYEVEGYTHDEIAGMLGISPGTSRSNLSRAKKMIKMLYQERIEPNCNEAI